MISLRMIFGKFSNWFWWTFINIKCTYFASHKQSDLELQRLKELDQAKRSEFKALSDSNVQDKRIGDKRPRLSSTNEFVATPKKPKVDDTRTSANIASGSTFTPIVPKKIDVQQTITEKSCITQFQPNTVSVTEPVDAVSRDEPTFHYTGT